MKIGVLSDTHMKAPDELLDRILDDIFQETNLILHAGDIVSLSVLQKLEEKNALAVCGNMDDFQVAGIIPQTRIIEVENKQIGIVHGWGSKDGLRERILLRFDRQSPDIIIYGHSHVPFWGEVGGVMMFNPVLPPTTCFPMTALSEFLKFRMTVLTPRSLRSQQKISKEPLSHRHFIVF